MSFRDNEIISTKPSRRAIMTFFGLVYYLIVLLCVCLVPGPTQYIILLWHDI